MGKDIIITSAIVVVIILAVIYSKSWVALGRMFQLSFFASLLLIPVFYSEVGYGSGHLSGYLNMSMFERTMSIISHSFGALQYGLLGLSLFCAVVALWKKEGKRPGWIAYIIADVLLYMILTFMVYDQSHSQFSFG